MRYERNQSADSRTLTGSPGFRRSEAVTLGLRAWRRINSANQIAVTRDGRKALDHLKFAEFAEIVAHLGADWLATNEPPHV